MASTTVTFVYGATTATFKAPDAGAQVRPSVPSAGIQTADGYFGYKLGALRYVFTLNFTAMNATDFAALMDFYDNTVQGNTLEFTYTDADGDAHTVRFFGDNAIQYTLQQTGRYDVAVVLRSTNRYS